MKNCRFKYYSIKFLSIRCGNSLNTTTVRHVPIIYLTFKVIEVKLFSLTLCLGLSVPEDVPRCSASVLTLLASFLNSVRATVEDYCEQIMALLRQWYLMKAPLFRILWCSFLAADSR